MKTVVMDASYMMAFLLIDEGADQRIEEEMNRGELKILVPPVFEAELFNGVLMAYRRDRISWGECGLIYKTYQRLPVVNEKIEIDEVFNLAKKRGLTVYDASYVWLAKKKKIKLLSYDKKMLGAEG